MSKGWHIFLGGYLLLIAFSIFVDFVVALSKYECYQRDWTDWGFIIGIVAIGSATLIEGLALKGD